MGMYDALLGTGIFVDKDTYTKRKEICKSCDFVIAKKWICGRCFCPIVNKAVLKSESCPMSKWDSESY